MAIKQGSRGSEVTALQKKLNSLGYGLSEDGIYGQKTAAAVADYQSKNGLSVDGIVGSQTSNSLYGSGTTSSDIVVSPTITTTSSKKTYSPTYEVEDYTPSAKVRNYESKLSDYEDDYEPYTQSQRVTDYENWLKEYENNRPSEYTQGNEVSAYKDKLKEYEDSEPGAFNSKYDATINEILDTIKNKGLFDLSSDANYQQLYDNYKESYTTAAKKAMRDSMASVNAATGGYGSTYSQIAAQQAYDNQMQGLNDQNLALMQIAYQMYGDDVANDYNKLSAYQSRDAVDYSRYRDDYSDWYNNRNYYANQYQNAYNNDYGQYRDTVNDWYNDRNYYANQYQNAYNNDYGQYRDSANDYYNTRNYYANQYQNAYNNDYGQYRDSVSDARNAYQDMEDTYTNAMSYASQGYELPSYLKAQLGDDDLSYFSGIAAQAQQEAASRSSSSGRSSSGSGTTSSPDYKTVASQAKAKKNASAAQSYLESMVDGGYITGDEALEIYDLYYGGSSSLGYGTPETYSEYVALTGESGIMTESEFKRAVSANSSRAMGYTNYKDYLEYMWNRFNGKES